MLKFCFRLQEIRKSRCHRQNKLLLLASSFISVSFIVMDGGASSQGGVPLGGYAGHWATQGHRPPQNLRTAGPRYPRDPYSGINSPSSPGARSVSSFR